MKKLWKIFGIIALVGVIGLGMAGCKTDGGGDDTTPSGGGGGGGGGTGGGGIPSELVAIWYTDTNNNKQVDEYEDMVAAYEFKGDGTLLVAGQNMGVTFSVSGDQITMSGATTSITFSINGNALTLSGSTASGFVAGNYAKK
jgi:hypothetical protein